MDPLSAVASIIAITQAVAAIGDGIKTLRSLAQASAEFCDMLNELSSPQALLDHLRSAMDDAVKSKSSLPSEALDRIAKFQVELSQIVNEIHVMANDLVRKSTGLNKVGEQKISGVRWQFRRGRITQLRDKARRCRDSISTCFDILGFSQMLHQGRMVINVHSLVETSTRRLNSQLDSFIAISQDQHRLVQSISESNKRVEDKAESLTAATGHLQQTADQVTNLVNRFDAIEEKLSTAISRTVTTAYSHPQAHHGSHFIQIQASVQQRCSRYCQCQCHRTVDFQTPRWARSIIGSIAMQYNSIPIFDPRRCNVPTCHSAKKGSLRVAYQFPKWLLNRALSITAIWGSLTNQGAALYLRLPRVINDNLINLAVTFTALERDRGLRISHVERLVEYKILPTDIVEESGETIFNHLISLGYAPTMVSLLEKSSIIGFNVQEL
ncbi:hypothetical protein B0T17DRAFT_181609 [Bombardia bombarda]|uniref:Fungal N-terminal domain-containing protein n=1 Tax=Bombardia bombarda TaxID=252184 RepID=A0AA40C955_9PEZI|nr:hypothetical protein B0T17DRAFT_181609 [Bombardia bombarda]